ncbi:FMN hydrolase / 5-amino-6-(5-phospho-D-ribitylamino)uracil phosphatase [Pelomyxa schiedti]|nr:FMN hydrolase / 5-amino-6-(5-phospho-D-ribitylamino)uracil phosphatase [Pelomyxa schiedti]
MTSSTNTPTTAPISASSSATLAASTPCCGGSGGACGCGSSTKDIRVVACDLDGTLLTHANTVSDECAAYIRKLQAQRGVRFVVSTGRGLSRTFLVKKFLPDSFHFVCLQGLIAGKYEANKATLLFEIPLPEGFFPALQKLALYTPRVEFALQEPDGTMYVNSPMSISYLNSIGFSARLCTDFSKLTCKIAKLMFPIANEESRQRVEDYITSPAGQELVRLNMRVLHTAFNVEIFPATADKAVALDYLVRTEFGLELDNVMCFGDDANDSRMLSMCGMSVCPSNATLAAISSAKKVSSWSNNQDCVLKELQAVFGPL